MRTHYFAATSNAPLAAVCEHLRRVFNTRPFEFDGHAHWEYAWADTWTLHFNVTRCPDTHTIEQWIPGTPKGVNYQIILTCPGFLEARTLSRVAEELQAALGAEVIAFHALHEDESEPAPAAPVKRPPRRARSAGESMSSRYGIEPSGVSPPLSWIFLVGVFIATVLLWRACA